MAQRSEILALVVKAETADARRELDRVADKVEGTAKRSEVASAKMARSFQTWGTALGIATGVGLAFVTAMDRFAEKAQKITNLSNGFDTLNRRIGATAGTFLPKLQKATLGQVNALDLMQQANQAVILGVAKSEDEFAELAEIATKLGRAIGLDATQALESMTTGIGRQSRMMLDNLGLIVDVEAAQKRYAASIGKTVAQLDDADKKQAFYNDTLVQGRQKTQGMSAATNTLADDWNRYKVQIVDATNALTDWINTNIRMTAFGTFAFMPPAARTPGMLEAQEMLRLRRLEQQRLQGLERPGFLEDGTFDTSPFGGLQPGEDRSFGGVGSGLMLGNPEAEFDKFLEIKERYQAELEQLDRDRTDALREGAAERLAIEADDAARRRALNSELTLGLIGNLTSLFGTSQQAAVAHALINTYQGVSRAIALTGGFGPAAAIALASGLAQVAAIKRTTFGSSGGGGGVGSFSGGGGGDSFGVGASPGGGTPQPVEVRIFLEGQAIIEDRVSFARTMADEIGRQLGRAGVNLVGI